MPSSRHAGPEIITDTAMPPFGVAQLLVGDTVPSTDLFRFWLLSHAAAEGRRFWRTAVLRECLPSAATVMEFTA